jgi:elongation factor G
MRVYDAASIRNLAVVGHGGCGKTSLVSALLFDMGAVTRLGRVDDGTAVTDFDPDEIERKISLQLAIAHGEWRKTKLNLLDAPGYNNFLSEARAGLRVADAALVVVDAVSGVEVQTEKVWGYAAEYGLPRLIVVNRMDRERAGFERTLESLQRAFGRSVAPLVLPLGEEKDFVGVADLLRGKADVYTDDQSGKFQQVDVPDHVKAAAQAARDKLVEAVAETDEKLMETFFDKGTLEEADLVRGLHEAVRAGKLFPVLPRRRCATSGCTRCWTRASTCCPPRSSAARRSASTRAPRATVARTPSAGAPSSAFVFKTIADPHAGRISVFRVYSGSVKADGTLHNVSRDTAERFGSVFLLQGKQQISVPEVQAGDIGGVAKLKETQTSDTLADKAAPIAYEPVHFPEPATTFAIEPKTRGDEDKISQSLRRIMEEDRVLRMSVDSQTHEMLLSGMGQLHVEVVVGKLKKRYKVEVNLKKPKIPYRETIKGAGRGPRPPQEADGRPRPVRRLQDPHEAAAARGGLQVRRRHLRRLDPQELHPGRGEGHPGEPRARVPGRLPDGRLPGGALRRPVPRRRLRRRCRSRSPARSRSRTRRQVPARRSSSRS